MKKLIVLFVCVLSAAGLRAQVQRYAFINSESVFKSLEDYNAAIKQLDDLAAQYQKNVEDAYAGLDELYENYQAQKAYLSETNRNQREEEIITREREINKYQQDVLGPEGDLMKERVELIKPIQDRVFAVIDRYAKDNDLGMIIDRTNNQTLLYYAPELDKTDEIIDLLKQ